MKNLLITAGVIAYFLLVSMNCVAQSEYELARKYQAERNYRQAIYWYERLTKQIRKGAKRDGVIASQHNTLLGLALCYDSIGSHQKALEYYSETYQCKIDETCHNDYGVAENMERTLIGMIRLYHLGLGTPKDSLQVKLLLKYLLLENDRIRGRVAYNGAKAINMALQYWDMPPTPQNQEMALFWLRNATQEWLRYPYANYIMGQVYENGWLGVSKNIEEAKRLYEKSAKEGYWEAKIKMGCLYEKGVLPQDYEKAFNFYQEIIKQAEEFDKKGLEYDRMQYYSACGRLGLMYYFGRYIQKDKIRSFPLLLLGSVNSLAESAEEVITALANCYQFGFGTEQDTERAKELLKQAEQLGSKDAEWFIKEEMKIKGDKENETRRG